MDKSGVQSVERTFAIIEALSKTEKGAMLGELSSATDLNKSTVHRLLNSLILMGYVSKTSENSRYFLTMKMFEVGSRIIRETNHLENSKPYLIKLSSETGEAVHMVVQDGKDIVYIFKVDSGNNSVRMSSRVGMRSPMYCTAVGKAILAHLSDDEVDKIWNESKVVSRTKNTITALDELKRQLEMIRENGYAVDDEENESGVMCVGASIIDYADKVVGAFSVSVPMIRMDTNRLKSISALVLKTRSEICSLPDSLNFMAP